MRLDDYMKELNEVSLLSAEEEAALWRAFKERGDQQARRRLIESYQPLVFKQALPSRRWSTMTRAAAWRSASSRCTASAAGCAIS